MKKNVEISVIVASIIFSLLFLLFIINPAVTGYTTYKQMVDKNISFDNYEIGCNDLEFDILELNKTLNECVIENQNLFVNNKLMEKSDLLCNLTIKNNENLIAGKDDIIESNRVKMIELYSENTILKEKVDNLDSIEQDYDELLQNVANSICCKAKVDNSNIDSFNVENNMVICGESGNNKISC